jgi:PIN domain nuclease of toxin-antitoxin system
VKRYLLDTHLVYWWMTADAKLGKPTQRLIIKSEIIVSAASMWEMTLKNARGKLPLPKGPIAEDVEAQGFLLLPILPRHIDAVRRLNFAHPDPFDRMLIAQANNEGLTFLTRDTDILGLSLDGVMEA